MPVNADVFLDIASLHPKSNFSGEEKQQDLYVCIHRLEDVMHYCKIN